MENMIEENDLDHHHDRIMDVEGNAPESPADCVNRDGMAQALNKN